MDCGCEEVGRGVFLVIRVGLGTAAACVGFRSSCETALSLKSDAASAFKSRLASGFFLMKFGREVMG